MSGLSAVVDQLLSAPAWLVYVAVFGFVFAEDAFFVGFAVPGETVALIGGAAANLGHVSLPLVLGLVVTAAVVGDSVGYAIGHRLGPALLQHRLLARHRPALERASSLLARRGGAAVLLGRWTAFFRAVMPALAGSAGMPYRRFLLWNGIGGVLWGSVVVLAGYALGSSYDSAATALGHGAAAVAAVLVVAGLVVWRVRRRRDRRTTPDAATPGSHDDQVRGDGQGGQGGQGGGGAARTGAPRS